MEFMRERENWDVLCDVCDKTIERGVVTESGDSYCQSCYDKLAYGNKDKKIWTKALFYYRKKGDLAIAAADSPNSIDQNSVLFLYVVMLSS